MSQVTVKKNLSAVSELPTVAVDAKSAWRSKINWTVILGVIANILMFFGIPVDPEVQQAVVAVVNGVILIAVWVMRTWFTTTVTKAAAGVQ